MSVINQMLQDLDKRKATQQTPELDPLIQSVTPSINREPQADNKKLTLVMSILGIIAILALGYYLGLTQTPEQSIIPKNETSETNANVRINSIQHEVNAASAIETQKTELANTEVTNSPSLNSEITHSDPRSSEAEPELLAQDNILPTNPKIKKDLLEIKTIRVLAQPVETRALPRPVANNPVILHQTKKKKTVYKPKKQTPSLDDSTSGLSIQRTKVDTPTLIAQQRKKADSALAKRNMSLARRHLNEILLLDATQNETRSELASLYFGSGKVNIAVSILEQGLVISPNYSNFRLLLARVFLKQDNSAQAYYYLKPLRPTVNNNLDYYAMLGALAQKNSDSKIAQESYLSLVKVQPDKAQWWLGLAIAQDTLGLKDQAKISYQQAQKMGQLSNSSRIYIEDRLKVLGPNS